MARYAFDEAWRAVHGRAATDDEYCDACADALGPSGDEGEIEGQDEDEACEEQAEE